MSILFFYVLRKVMIILLLNIINIVWCQDVFLCKTNAHSLYWKDGLREKGSIYFLFFLLLYGVLTSDLFKFAGQAPAEHNFYQFDQLIGSRSSSPVLKIPRLIEGNWWTDFEILWGYWGVEILSHGSILSWTGDLIW